MATKKKAAVKPAAAKKAAPKKEASKRNAPVTEIIIKESPPIRIVIEVVVRIENEGVKNGNIKSFLAPYDANNFSYAFDLQNCTITNLTVESFELENPPVSGEFFAPIIDPGDPKTIRVIVIAIQDSPKPYGTLTLKYLSKDVFITPEQISFSEGRGKINKNVNLPK